jgi:hypothetical protein
MSKRSIEGICHLCGTYGPLSFEHVPPRAAFNNRPVIALPFDRVLGAGPGEEVRGRKQQQGIGCHSLCPKCNNDLGGWYSRRFVDWCYQGAYVLARSGGKPRLIYLHHIRPLPVIKQVLGMFFSINEAGTLSRDEYLVRFLLNKEMMHLPSKYRFFAYYNLHGRPRTSQTMAVVKFDTGSISLQTEIAHPPYGYVLTLDGGRPLDRRLVEISHFASYEYDQEETVPLHLPVLPTHSMFGADYRTQEEIDRDAARSGQADSIEDQ